jgi:polysaccharide chain length determinant protein (PEP-CTERM system associated)
MGTTLRRKWWIILPTLGLFIVATLLARGIPDLYRAETVILVDLQQVPDKYVPEETMAANIPDRLRTLEQQILSPMRVQRLVESEHLYPDRTGKKTEEELVKAIQARIAVEVLNPGGPKLGALKITYSATRRDEVGRVAGHIAQIFVEENQNTGVEQSKGTKNFIESQLQETKKQLDDKESQLSLIKTRNILDPPESKPLHMKALAGLRVRYQAIQEKISQNQQDKAILQSKLASGGEAPAAGADIGAGTNGNPGRAPSIAKSPSLSSQIYETKIQELEGKLVELRTRYGPTHPYVLSTQAELDRLKAGAEVKSQNQSGPQNQQRAMGTTALRRNNPALEARIAKLDEDSAEQTKQLESLKKQMDFHRQRLEQIPAAERQLASLQRDYDTLKTEYTSLLDKKRAAEMSSTFEGFQRGERFVVLNPAVPPETPYAPNRFLISLGGLLGGLFGGIVLAFIAEVKDQRVRSENDASRIFGKPVLGNIPRIISLRERRRRRLNAVGMVAGTVAGAAGLGLALSLVAARLF